MTDGTVRSERSLSRPLKLKIHALTSDIESVSTRYASGSQVTYSYRSGAQELPFEDEARNFSQVFSSARETVSGSYDTGHEFSTVKSYMLNTTFLHGVHCVDGNDFSTMLTGETGIPEYGFMESDGTLSLNKKLTLNDINVYGAQAIGATIPTTAKAGLAQMIGELKRDGLPSGFVANTARHPSSPRAYGSDYLNLEFGIRPLVSDIRKLLVSISTSSKLLKQYQRDSGRVVRRGFSFPAETSVTTRTRPGSTISGEAALNLDGFLRWDSAGTELHETVTSSRNLYFKGAFTYYMDVGSTLISKLEGFEQKANYLLGLRLTPEVLWDLAPWSWFADWFATFGLSLSNASAFQSDGLVIRYGYLMCHTVTDKTIYRDVYLRGTTVPIRVSTTYRTERKERYKATPYGFGLNVADFDPRKWAILGALGLTMAPGKMR